MQIHIFKFIYVFVYNPVMLTKDALHWQINIYCRLIKILVRTGCRSGLTHNIIHNIFRTPARSLENSFLVCRHVSAHPGHLEKFTFHLLAQPVGEITSHLPAQLGPACQRNICHFPARGRAYLLSALQNRLTKTKIFLSLNPKPLNFIYLSMNI